MSIQYTKDIYNQVVKNKIDNENLIKQLYSELNNYTYQQQVDTLAIIDALKNINDEYLKYKIIFERQFQPAQVANSYIIIQGDTLHRIAQKMLGSHTRWSEISKLNNINDLLLIPGDSLKLPL